ncbi:Cupredoxin [Plenodomus tracheiphilus IPT5]|uniref:Cupredoxin n=1 Tax=Plenodomus tracheiphilus IPT5 TaxID=1408161 RepID=A0A6A7B8S7_9PLEO|nr:Cupredoxin [Plenodomus tracheiphilus IPT5]
MCSPKILSLASTTLLLCFAAHAAPFKNTTSSTLTATPTSSRWISPRYTWIFEYPLPILPVKEPKLTYTNSTSGAVVDYYEIEVRAIQKQIYPNLGVANMYAYDGLQPGPTFMMHKGREAVVRFTNNSPTNSSVHVHGQYNRAPFDGWAADYAVPGQYKDYYYPNAQNARTIWYHDHTEFETGENVYMGLDGFYLLSDDEEEALNLPKGQYDIALSICSKQYGNNGELIYNTNGDTGVWGDIIQVNGQPWPYLEVEPRKYRLRLLNGAVSRTFDLSFNSDVVGEPIPFIVIASDAGLFSHPIETTHLGFSMGERYELIVDFAGFEGQTITMRNAHGVLGNIDYAATDRVMRFVIGETVTSPDAPIPSELRYIPPPPQTSVSKNFTFSRTGDEWQINGVGWADVAHRILTRPTLGADEIWELRHGGGNATHPVHIHLVDFQVLSRTGGRNAVSAYEAAGMKDVVWMAPNETVRVVARYAPWKGVYMFHCHNLVHEDHDMLVAFNVTQLEQWGYDSDTLFIDPMEPAFRPKNVVPEDYTDEAIKKKLEWFLSSNAYNQTSVTFRYCPEAESEYWLS